MIRCRVARRRIDDALERALSLEQRFELDEHLAGCPACAGHERRARGLQELLEGPGDPPASTPDVEAAARAVFAALARGEGKPWQPRRQRRGLGVALVGGLVLASAAGVALWLALHAPTSPPAPRTEPRPVADADEPSASATAAVTPEWTTASVEARVRAALLECFESAGVDEVRAWERFHELTREPLRAGWPVRRFVEGLLESPDTAAALAAARCLASLGEPSAAPMLERALGRPALAETVLDALGALGEPALPALERALDRPELGARALLQLCRVGGPRAAAALERAARGAREHERPSREALLDALTSTGPAAVTSLLSLASEAAARGAREDAAAILARLALVADAGAELARLLAQERLEEDLAFVALLALRAPEALPWLEERCLAARTRGPALEVLASYEGLPPLGAVVRLARAGRVPRADVLALLSGLLERDAERAVGFSSASAGPEAHEWLTLLIESGHPGAPRALVPLVARADLPGEDRQWAALALCETATHEDALRLCDALAGNLPSDRRLLAACLVAAHAGLGSGSVEVLLAPCSAATRRRVLAALEENARAGEAVRVHRIARALEGALTELAALTPDGKEAP